MKVRAAICIQDGEAQQSFDLFVMAYGGVLCNMRVGEALRPGPWSLTACTPTGLATKAHEFKGLLPGISAISETHLTTSGVARFKAEMKFEGVTAKYHPGHPVEFRTTSKRGIGGKNGGVGFLTSFPARPIPGDWQIPPRSWRRVLAAHFLVDQQWVSGGVCYAPAHNAANRDVRNFTDDLLQELYLRIADQPRPKFLAGDWNQLPGSVQIMAELEMNGWRDSQGLAYQRWNRAPQVTCKQNSRKGFVYLCPLLQQHLMDVQVIDYTFPDHGVLRADFSDLGAVIPRSVWPKPKPIVWSTEEKEQLEGITQT